MQNRRPPGEKKPFLVRPASGSIPAPRTNLDRLFDLIDNALIPLTFVFLGVVFLAGYLFMTGKADSARDIIVIFLPPICALMGAASAGHFRH